MHEMDRFTLIMHALNGKTELSFLPHLANPSSDRNPGFIEW